MTSTNQNPAELLAVPNIVECLFFSFFYNLRWATQHSVCDDTAVQYIAAAMINNISFPFFQFL